MQLLLSPGVIGLVEDNGQRRPSPRICSVTVGTRSGRPSRPLGEELGDLVLAGSGEVIGQRPAEEVHAGLEAEPRAGFVEAGDRLGFHAQGQDLHVGALAVGRAAADWADVTCL
jgi:hypothetical protein